MMVHLDSGDITHEVLENRGMQEHGTRGDRGLELPLVRDSTIIREYERNWARKSHRQSGITVLAVVLGACAFATFCDPHPVVRLCV